MPLPSPYESMEKLLERIVPLERESVELAQSAGRILAGPLKSDRPSPPADVSAMDGYAICLGDLTDVARPVPISGEVAIGHAPPPLSRGQAVRIFTGGAVPLEADAIIPREQVKEAPDSISIPPDLGIQRGQHIRRRGDNLAANQTVLESGQPITAAGAAALGAFGDASPQVYRRVRLSIIVTGNELLPVNSSPQPWQLRDSNGPMLASLFSNVPWIEMVGVHHAADDLSLIQSVLRSGLEQSDAILLTGGVSMGDYDHVPAVIQAVGGRIVFHKLAIRPGKPLLGAVGPQNQVIFGLPGNPVSALITARRWAAVALRKQGGFTIPDPAPATLAVSVEDGERPFLWWYRAVRIIQAGQGELVATQGSGDLVSAARSDGFIEISPERKDSSFFPYHSWSLM
jgi:molybdopterin molybdotransferase